MRRAFVICALLIIAGCDDRDPVSAHLTVRVGYFPNVTHSQALAGLARGDFQRALGTRATVTPIVFNAGPSVIEALFAGRIDLAYVGPNPAINGFVQSRGKALRIVAGATSGGAALVVRRDAHIRRAADLSGRRLASPQFGNTQDVALRRYLGANGLAPRENGGNVQIIPTANPQILELFRRGDIDGAWVPEPWASRLVIEGDGVLLLDERSLWPHGDFTTANVIASTDFLRAHPDLVRSWLEAHVEVTQWEVMHPREAQQLVNAEIGRITGRKLGDAVLASAWERMRPTWDPIAASLTAGADAAWEAHLLRQRPNLEGIYDLRLLGDVLSAKKLAGVSR